MADKLDISLPAYSKIERNITDISFSRLNQIAKTFNISVIELLSVSSTPKEQDYKKIISEKENEIITLQKRIITLLDKKK